MTSDLVKRVEIMEQREKKLQKIIWLKKLLFCSCKNEPTFPGGMIRVRKIGIVTWSKQMIVYHLQAAIFQALVFP